MRVQACVYTCARLVCTVHCEYTVFVCEHSQYIHVQACMCTHVCIAGVHVHVSTHGIYTCSSMRVHTCAHMCTCMGALMVCMHVRACVHTCVGVCTVHRVYIVLMCKHVRVSTHGMYACSSVCVHMCVAGVHSTPSIHSSCVSTHGRYAC